MELFIIQSLRILAPFICVNLIGRDKDYNYRRSRTRTFQFKKDEAQSTQNRRLILLGLINTFAFLRWH